MGKPSGPGAASAGPFLCSRFARAGERAPLAQTPSARVAPPIPDKFSELQVRRPAAPAALHFKRRGRQWEIQNFGVSGGKLLSAEERVVINGGHFAASLRSLRARRVLKKRSAPARAQIAQQLFAARHQCSGERPSPIRLGLELIRESAVAASEGQRKQFK